MPGSGWLWLVIATRFVALVHLRRQEQVWPDDPIHFKVVVLIDCCYWLLLLLLSPSRYMLYPFRRSTSRFDQLVWHDHAINDPTTGYTRMVSFGESGANWRLVGIGNGSVLSLIAPLERWKWHRHGQSIENREPSLEIANNSALE
jgi:hypothetical protein